jgi:hypothetical protein
VGTYRSIGGLEKKTPKRKSKEGEGGRKGGKEGKIRYKG